MRGTSPLPVAEQARTRVCAAHEAPDERLLHVINETARYAGHADAVRELLDGVTGE